MSASPAPASSPSASPVQCITLDANTPCGPDFAGFPVLGQYFPNVGAFSDSISNVIGNLDALSNMFVNMSGCDANLTRQATNRLRYQRSVWCASAVHDAITLGCNVGNNLPARGPLLCASQCSAAVSTLTSVLGNTTVCPSSASREDLATRTTMLDNLRNYCNTAQSGSSSNSTSGGNSTNSSNPQCVNGVQQENQNCGWMNATVAREQCALISSDPCCQRMIANSTTPTNNSSSSPNPSSSPFAGSNSDNQNRDLSVRTPIWIPLLAAVFTLGLLIPGAVFGWRAYKNHQSRVGPDDDDNHFGNAKKKEMHEKNRDSSASSGFLSAFNAFAAGFTTSDKQSKPDEKESTSTAANKGNDLEKGDSSDGKPFIVIATYDAKLPDELTLEQGMSLFLIKDFGDGWGLGMNPETGKMGAFPLVCCKPHPNPASITKSSVASNSVPPSPPSTNASSLNAHALKPSKSLSSKSGTIKSKRTSSGSGKGPFGSSQPPGASYPYPSLAPGQSSQISSGAGTLKKKSPSIKSNHSGNSSTGIAGPPLPRINALGQKMPLTIADGSSDEEDYDTDASPISPLPLNRKPSGKERSDLKSTEKEEKGPTSNNVLNNTLVPPTSTAMLLMPPKPEITQQLMASVPATIYANATSHPMMMAPAAASTTTFGHHQPMMMSSYPVNTQMNPYAVPMAYTVSSQSSVGSNDDRNRAS